MTWKRYPQYKDSGIEWLGEIPELWEIKRVKTMLSRNDSGVWGDDFDDEGVVVLRSTEQTVGGDWIIIEPAKRRLSVHEYVSAILKEGDLVVTKSSGSSLHIGKTSIVTKEIAALNCCYSNFMQRLRVQPTVDPWFMRHVLNGEIGRKQFDYLSSTTTGLANLNSEIIGNVIASFPSEGEQRAIAAFLGRETERIDTLITKKERQIELLQEKRTALISHAVTKGLNPDVKMKDSGIEWLGEIPEHWEILSIKRITSIPITDGPHETPKLLDEGISFISAEAIKNDKIDFAKMRGFISLENHAKFSRKYKPRRGDIYLIKSGATTGNVAFVDTDDEFNIWSPLAAIRPDPKKAITPFVFFFMKSKNFFQSIELGWSYGTQQNIGMNVIENIPIALPPLEEQESIAALLNTNIIQIDEIASKVENSIDLLHEYRTALISAAVTGKIDVRKEVA